MWIALALISASLLGTYDIFKKISLKGNAVIPVLAASVFISALLFLPLIPFSHFCPQEARALSIYLPAVDWQTHLHILLKSAIVLTSWIAGYFGMKNIPITIFAPIRATQPMWTVMGAFIIFAERLTPWQIAGVSITIISFYLFSLAGIKEGISWKSNRWIWLIVVATLLGAASGLYDKYMMLRYDRVAVQVYSTFYQAMLMALITLLLWYPQRKTSTPFRWRWAIAGISVFLILSDFLYFRALSMDGALISIVSTIRRSGAVMPFLYGALFLRERNLRVKTLLLLGVMLGVMMIYWGR